MKSLSALLRQHFFEYSTYSFLGTWTVMQGIFSRTFRFDNVYAVNTFEQVAQQLVAQQLKPSGFWLNIQVKFMNCKLCSTLFQVVLVSFAHVGCNIKFLNIVASCAPFGDRIIHMICVLVDGRCTHYIFFLERLECIYFLER